MRCKKLWLCECDLECVEALQVLFHMKRKEEIVKFAALKQMLGTLLKHWHCLYFVTCFTISEAPFTKEKKASLTWFSDFIVLKSFDETPSLRRIPSMRKPSVAVVEIVSLHTIYLEQMNHSNIYYWITENDVFKLNKQAYRGLVTPLRWCSSCVGAAGSIKHIFSYMSFLSFGFSFAFINSSSKYVRTPILQSITQGFEKCPSRSSSSMNSRKSD